MKLVYTAAKYTSADPWQAEQNVRRAEEAAYEIMKLGGLWPVCPHSNTRHYFAAACTYEQAIEATLELMRRCDAAFFCPGWEQSSGARGEHEEALRLGMPIFYDLEALAAWRSAMEKS
jgi:hypothetical protein